MNRNVLFLSMVSVAVCLVPRVDASPQAGALPFVVEPGQRQLFLDDVGIAARTNLSRSFHQPEKKGAVIVPDQTWEYTLQTRCAPQWDPAVERFKLWMITSTTIPGLAEMTYAESADGLLWTKPALRQKDIQGSLENNIVTVDPKREWGSNAMENVVYDPDDPDPARRFKGFANVYSREPIISPDGIHWTLLDAPALDSQDESNLSYDRVTGTFIATLKTSGVFGRTQAIWTSTDFAHWTNTGVIFHADEIDQARGKDHVADRMANLALHQTEGLDPAECKVDVYNLGIARYEGLYLGFPAMFHQSGEAGFHLVQLASSRDLKTWERLGDRATFIGPSAATEDTYDWTQLLPPSGPVIHDDELWFYYTGIKYRKPPEGAAKIGAICLAVLRRDGFISLDANDEVGTLLTESFTLTGSRLFVNVDARQGTLGIELLDTDGEVLAMSTPVTGDQLRAEVLWEQGNLTEVVGKEVRIRFTLRNGAFYSYWLGEG